MVDSQMSALLDSIVHRGANSPPYVDTLIRAWHAPKNIEHLNGWVWPAPSKLPFFLDCVIFDATYKSLLALFNKHPMMSLMRSRFWPSFAFSIVSTVRTWECPPFPSRFLFFSLPTIPYLDKSMTGTDGTGQQLDHVQASIHPLLRGQQGRQEGRFGGYVRLLSCRHKATICMVAGTYRMYRVYVFILIDEQRIQSIALMEQP